MIAAGVAFAMPDSALGSASISMGAPTSARARTFFGNRAAKAAASHPPWHNPTKDTGAPRPMSSTATLSSAKWVSIELNLRSVTAERQSMRKRCVTPSRNRVSTTLWPCAKSAMFARCSA